MPVAQTRASNPARTGGSGHGRSTSRSVHSTGLVGHLDRGPLKHVGVLAAPSPQNFGGEVT